MGDTVLQCFDSVISLWFTTVGCCRFAQQIVHYYVGSAYLHDQTITLNKLNKQLAVLNLSKYCSNLYISHLTHSFRKKYYNTIFKQY